MISNSRKPIMIASLLQVLVAIMAGGNGVVAKFHQGNNWLGAVQHRQRHHAGGWGLKNHAKLNLLKSGNAGTLDSFLLQVRGGSSYNGDYYDNNNRRGNGGGGGGGYYNEDDGYDTKGFDSREWGDNNDYQDDYRNDYSSSSGRYDDYDDRGRSSSRSRDSSDNAVQSSFSSLQSKIKNGDRRLGGLLLGMGAVFTVLGVSLFFNKALMRLGNLSFIAGVPVFIGPSRTAGYFLKPEKIRATACLAAGIFLVFVGWPIFGMALEVFGLMNLFGNMFPMFWAIFKNLPIVSSLTSGGGNSGGFGSGGGGRRRQSYRDYGDDDPYGDDSRGYGDYRDEDAERYY